MSRLTNEQLDELVSKLETARDNRTVASNELTSKLIAVHIVESQLADAKTERDTATDEFETADGVYDATVDEVIAVLAGSKVNSDLPAVNV